MYRYNDNNNQSKNNAYTPYQPYGYTHATDYGPYPFVVDINKATLRNATFRTALWTGTYLQVTVMSIPAGEDIGLEVHHDDDQLLHIVEGHGLIQMGDRREHLTIQQPVCGNFAVFVPAGTWHNITNTGKRPLKLTSVYAPPDHPRGTVHETKAIAEAMETGK